MANVVETENAGAAAFGGVGAPRLNRGGNKNVESLLNFISAQLFDANLTKPSAYGQCVKQFLYLMCGIETSRQDSMNVGTQAVFAAEEYQQWINHIQRNHPGCAVLPYLQHTTATKKQPITGSSIMKSFKAGLKRLHGTFTPVWKEIMGGQISGKSPEDIWRLFLKKLKGGNL